MGRRVNTAVAPVRAGPSALWQVAARQGWLEEYADWQAPTTRQWLAHHGDDARAALRELRRLRPALDDRLCHYLTEALGLPRARLQPPPPPALLALADGPRWQAWRLLPLAETAAPGPLLVATEDPLETAPLDALARLTNRAVEARPLSTAELDAALRRHIGTGALGEHEAATGPGWQVAEPTTASTTPSPLDLADSAARAWLDHLLATAQAQGVSDVHLHPLPGGTVTLRWRQDGRLATASLAPPSADLFPAVLARAKLLAGLDVAERRRPQDGLLRATLPSGQPVAARAAVVPTVHPMGEALALRFPLVEQTGSLEALGMSPRQAEALRAAVQSPEGLFLATGPTGCGKTTTLYALLSHLHTPERKLITIEDPVEAHLPGVTQVAVGSGGLLGFAGALRAVLRQAPDVLLVGEIRDRPTAETALQAALSGHLVLSSLHTRTVWQVPARLVDLGVAPFLLAAGLRGVVGQRLRPRPTGPGRIGEFTLWLLSESARAALRSGELSPAQLENIAAAGPSLAD